MKVRILETIKPFPIVRRTMPPNAWGNITSTVEIPLTPITDSRFDLMQAAMDFHVNVPFTATNVWSTQNK